MKGLAHTSKAPPKLDIKARAARKHYGCEMDAPYDERLHGRKKKNRFVSCHTTKEVDLKVIDTGMTTLVSIG